MIDELRNTGMAKLGLIPWVDEFTAYLAKCEKYPGHVAARPRAGIWCNRMWDVMAAPHFLDYARSLTPIATEYFGEPAHLWSLNAFYTDEKTPYIPSIHGLHRDTEAEKILVLFMFGTDVDITGVQILSGPDGWKAMGGDKGTAWLADTGNYHCGMLSKIPRMIAWARWANIEPPAKFSEQLPDL